MKKIICSLLLASSLVLVSAQETANMSTSVNGDVIVTPTVVDGGVDMTGTTGDPKTDNKLQALRASYKVKFQALREQFKTDLKALIGERKLKQSNRNAETKERMKETEETEEIEEIRAENVSDTKLTRESEIKNLIVGKDGRLRVKDNRSFFQRLFGIGN